MPNCECKKETTYHYLIECPAYEFARTMLFEKMRMYGINATMRNMLTNANGVELRVTLEFVHDTHCMTQRAFGEGLQRHIEKRRQ